MPYVIVETPEPLDGPIVTYGPVETKEEAFELKLRVAHTKAHFIKIVELDCLEVLDPYNYVENRKVDP